MNRRARLRQSVEDSPQRTVAGGALKSKRRRSGGALREKKEEKKKENGARGIISNVIGLQMGAFAEPMRLDKWNRKRELSP